MHQSHQWNILYILNSDIDFSQTVDLCHYIWWMATPACAWVGLQLLLNFRFLFNTLRPRQNGCQVFDIFKCIFWNENVWFSIEISLKFVSKFPIHNIPTLAQIMAWHRPGGKPLSEPMKVRLLVLTHICLTRPQWVNNEISMNCDTKSWLILSCWGMI